MLGYAQAGGLADIEAAEPELVLLLGADEMAADRFDGRVQGLHRPPRRQGRASRPTWSCRARPMPKSTAPTSTPKAACSAASGPRSRRARRARIGRSCAPSRELAGSTLPFDSFDQLRAAMVARISAARPRRPDRPAVGAAEARRQGRRPDPLPDRRLLPDQRDLPHQPDHAALLGRALIQRPSPSSQEAAEVTDRALPALGHELRLGVVPRHDHRHPRHRAAADAGGGDDHLCRAQDLGGDRASPRARTWSGRGACCRASPTA